MLLTYFCCVVILLLIYLLKLTIDEGRRQLPSLVLWWALRWLAMLASLLREHPLSWHVVFASTSLLGRSGRCRAHPPPSFFALMSFSYWPTPVFVNACHSSLLAERICSPFLWVFELVLVPLFGQPTGLLPVTSSEDNTGLGKWSKSIPSTCPTQHSVFWAKILWVCVEPQRMRTWFLVTLSLQVILSINLRHWR